MLGTDDTTKSKTEVYEDRNAVALALVRTLIHLGYDAGYREDPTSEWPAVAIDLDVGEVGWHVPPELLVDHKDWMPEIGQEYNYYSREAKNARLLEFAQDAPRVEENFRKRL